MKRVTTGGMHILAVYHELGNCYATHYFGPMGGVGKRPRVTVCRFKAVLEGNGFGRST